MYYQGIVLSAGTNFPPGATPPPPLVKYCQFGVSPVNHSAVQDQHLCFRICRLLFISCGGSYYDGATVSCALNSRVRSWVYMSCFNLSIPYHYSMLYCKSTKLHCLSLENIKALRRQPFVDFCVLPTLSCSIKNMFSPKSNQMEVTAFLRRWTIIAMLGVNCFLKLQTCVVE